jgi:hypothetical protein
MRMIVTILVGIIALASQACGASQTSAFTNSFLVSSCSEFAASRTISENFVTTPDLNYKSSGQVDSYVTQPGGGNAIINQEINSMAQNIGKLGGMASFSSKVTASNVKSSSLIMTGVSTTEVCNKQDNSKIESQTFGLGLAKPGEGEYSFEVNGEQTTVSNMAPALAVIPVYNNELLNKELIIAFEQIPSEFEKPVDVIKQEVNFDYGTYNNQPTFYNYDVTNTIAVEDTTCSSSMSFSHVN